jgi:predicted transcriptional regulator
MEIGVIILVKAPVFDTGEENISFETILNSKGRIKVLRVLLRYTELPISRIVKFTNLDPKMVKYYIEYLVKIQVLQEKTSGRTRIYRLRIEDSRVRAIKDLFDSWEES